MYQNKVKIVIVSIIFALFHQKGIAQQYFETKFGCAGLDNARSVKQLSSSSIFVAGYSDTASSGNIDFALHKLTKEGALVFTKYYGNLQVNNCLNMNLTNSSKIIMCGETYTSNINFDAQLLCLDTNGVTIWQTQFGDSLKNESLKYITETSDHFILTCGFVTDSSGSNDFLFVKLDSLGNIVWKKNYGDTLNNTANMCIELSNGNYALVGDTKSSFGDYDVKLILTDKDGNIIWNNNFGNKLQNGSQGIFESTDQQLVFYGETEIAQASLFDFFVQKVNLNGVSSWRKTFGGAKSDALFNGIEVSDGFVFTGYSNSYNSGPLNLVVLKTDTLANISWLRSFGGNAIDIGYSVIESKLNDGYYVSGISTVSGNTQNYLLHLTEQGYLDLITNERYTKNVIIYPNPSNGFFEIKNDEKFDDILVLNIYGQCVFESKLTNSKINLNKLAKGVYFVVLKNENEQVREKIVLE
jgi:hypothetical protein